MTDADRSDRLEGSRFSRRALLRSATALALLPASARLTSACGAPVRTAAPPGLEPLESTNMAPPPDAVGGDARPETVRFVSGQGMSYAWVHGRGYVKAPLAQVWPALRNPDACTNRREVTEYMVTQATQPAYAYSFRVHNIVRAVITVEFDVDWRLDVTLGALDAPTAVAARFEKTMGSDVISLMRGSMIARAVDATTTEVELIEHLDALGRGAETAQAFLQDYFNSVVELAHARPLPTYR